MKKLGMIPLVEIAILAFCVWLARDLPNAWRHSPYDRLGWLALLLWLAPLLVFPIWKRCRSVNPCFLGAAIALGALGDLMEFHFLCHFALALALAAWLPFSSRLLLWLAAALAWMPVLGWELSHCSSAAVIVIRLILALTGVVILSPTCRAAKK